MLRFLKKRWKSHKLSKKPASPETSTHQITNIGAGPSDSEYFPRITSMGLIRPSNQIPITEGALRSQLGTGGLEINNFLCRLPRPRLLDTTVAMQVSAASCCYCSLCLFPTPIALQGRGHTRRGSAGTQSERLGRNTPDLYSERGSNTRDQGGTVIQQPLETTPKRTLSGDRDGGDGHDLVQSGRSRGKP